MIEYTLRLKENLKKHILEVSDPRLKGRLAGTPGAATAASYLADQLRTIGIEPAGANEYFEPFAVPATRLAGPVTLKVGNWNLRHRIDFGEMRLSSGGTHTGKLVVIKDGEDVAESLENKIILIPKRPEDFDLESTAKAGIELGIKGLLFEEGEPRWFYKTTTVFAELGIPIIRIRKSIANELEKRAGDDVTISLPIEISKKQCSSVMGILPGKNSDFTIALTAHYDHIGDDPHGYKFPGVLDNASGVATVLELIRKLKNENVSLPYNILIAFLTGEESGHWGAKHLIQHQPLPLSAVINFDVLGLDPDFREVRIGQIDTSHWLYELADSALKKYGVAGKIQKGEDDSSVFMTNGIPAIGFGEYSLHNIGPKIHTPDDRIEALHYEPLLKVIDITTDMLTKIYPDKITANN